MCYELLWSEDSSSIFYQDIFLRIFKNLYKECSQDLSEVKILKRIFNIHARIFKDLYQDP